jgi:hypothetical protein
MKNGFQHIILLSILLMVACKERVSQEQLIESAVEIRLSQWREEQIKMCRDQALVKAEEYVDSVLVAISLETKLDTISKPEKPMKPPKPSFRKKPDSLVVDPIIKKGRE